ncbi:MAG: hypothetical protein KJO08_06360 [Gammaproteobacteria bacterium]|nr:hypothetical protein [Gammaproteobacteria bacterium]NNJ83969.1 hypothetical protein [Gammaproteobacteria bacterium]
MRANPIYDIESRYVIQIPHFRPGHKTDLERLPGISDQRIIEALRKEMTKHQ